MALGHEGEGARVLVVEGRAEAEAEAYPADALLDDGAEVDGRGRKGARGDGAAAGLVTGKAGPVEDEDAGAGLRQVIGGTAAGGAGAGDRYVVLGHVVSLARPTAWGRGLPRSNTTTVCAHCVGAGATASRYGDSWSRNSRPSRKAGGSFNYLGDGDDGGD